MEKDILLKTTFRGFDKKAVMDYIEQIQKENVELKAKVTSLEQEVLSVQKEAAETEEKYKAAILDVKNAALEALAQAKAVAANEAPAEELAVTEENIAEELPPEMQTAEISFMSGEPVDIPFTMEDLSPTLEEPVSEDDILTENIEEYLQEDHVSELLGDEDPEEDLDVEGALAAADAVLDDANAEDLSAEAVMADETELPEDPTLLPTGDGVKRIKVKLKK